MPFAPSTRPARTRIGGTWSIPEIRPLATDGAAPSTTTKKIAASDFLKSRTARGNQAIEGIVCRPVISEPTALRTTRNWATAIPTSDPMTIATPNPTKARRIVVPIARQVIDVPRSLKNRGSTVAGPGST
ncbi:unannotated protein [freshwater metagenome]|uniref:Unannotated protein n=1 Tax=freshwater metagenome TaxID=449393 RepID=A0A6J6VT88_9ZZZZ